MDLCVLICFGQMEPSWHQLLYICSACERGDQGGLLVPSWSSWSPFVVCILPQLLM